MTNKNEAFQDIPPTVRIDGKDIQLKPLTGLIQSFLAAEFRDNPDLNSLFVKGYIFTASRPGAEAVAARDNGSLASRCESLALDLSEEDAQAILDYLTRIIERREASQVDTPETPGKPEAETLPPN